MRALIALGLAMFLALISPARADQPPTEPVKVASVEGISEYHLANGLRVLLAPDESKPTTTVNVTYQVGSRMERYGETGMAHLLEHLLFKGTDAYPDKTIVQEFAKRGMRYNGSTWYDRTNYFETFTAGDDNLDWALKMEADRMVHSHIWRQDLDSEMTVVRNEMEQGENSPFRILLEKMTAAAFQWHSYGKDTIGARSDVENVNIEHLQAFYRTYYQPDNAVLIVTGKFDPAKTLARIVADFGAIAKPSRTLEPLWTVEPVQDGARAVTLARVGDTPWVAALYHVPPGAAEDFAAVQLLDEILGNTPNGRLYKALVQKKLAANITSFVMPLHDPGYIFLGASLEKSQSRDKAMKALLDTVEKVKAAPITEEELKRAKIRLANQTENLMDDPAKFGVLLSEAIAAGDWRLLFLDRDRIANASLADVQRAADNYLKESNRTQGEFIPTEKPDRAPALGKVDVEKMVADYKGNDAVAAGEQFDPSPANIEKRLTRETLPGGLQLALLPKRTRGNTVSGHITLDTGDEKSLFGKATVGHMAGLMLQRGAGKLDRKQIADRMAELKTTLAINAGPGQVTVNFETKRSKLPEAVALIETLLKQPTFPEDELQQLKTEMLSGIDANRHQPTAMAQNALGRYDNPYPKGDVRYAATYDEQVEMVKAVTVADLKAFHANFYGANHGHVAVVGDFDKAEIEKQLATLFDGWKARQPYSRVPNPYRPSPAAAIRLEAPDKANAFYLAGLAIPIRDDDPAATALMLGDRILGGGGLKSRIADRLRQKDGISYGAGSGLQLNPFEPSSALYLQAIYAPQNLPKLQAGVGDVIATLLKDGVTEQEVAEAKSGMLQAWTISRTQDTSLAAQLSNQLRIGRTMDFVAKREAELQNVTVDQVNEVLRRYLDPAHLVQVYAGDFAKAEKSANAGGEAK